MNSSRWGTILPSKSARELAEGFRKSLFDRMSETGTAESMDMLYGIRAELERELAAGRRIPQEIMQLIEGMAGVSSTDELKIFLEEFTLLEAELFRARSSVSMACTLARSFQDSLVMTACGQSVRLLEAEGRKAPETPWAVLVSGEMGREETVLCRRSSFLFIYQKSAVGQEYCDELAQQFMAVLMTCFPGLSRNMNSPSAFWSGTDSGWVATVTTSLEGRDVDSNGMTYAAMFETVADMRFLSGDHDFGRTVIEAGRKQLADSLHSELFWHLAKDIAAMPVALSIFGRFKTVKTGSHRGAFDLKEFALGPLAAAARIMALSCGGVETSFAGRIKAILASGNMGVALADRLLIAYQDFMREKIRLELTAREDEEELFCNPEQLDEDSRERIKAGLEEITTLQRLVHQQLVEVDQV